MSSTRAICHNQIVLQTAVLISAYDSFYLRLICARVDRLRVQTHLSTCLPICFGSMCLGVYLNERCFFSFISNASTLWNIWLNDRCMSPERERLSLRFRVLWLLELVEQTSMNCLACVVYCHCNFMTSAYLWYSFQFQGFQTAVFKPLISQVILCGQINNHRCDCVGPSVNKHK